MGCQIWISDGDKNLPRVNAGMIIAKPVRDRAVFFQERNALLTQ
jgi:ribonuclease HII